MLLLSLSISMRVFERLVFLRGPERDPRRLNALPQARCGPVRLQTS